MPLRTGNGYTWDFAVCTYSELKDGFIWYGPDFYGELLGGGELAECVSPFGFASRPLDPDLDADGNVQLGAGLLVLEHGGQTFAIPTQDPRYQALPPVPKGSSMLYGTMPSGKTPFILVDGQTGTIQLYSPHTSAKGSSIAMSVGTDGTESIQIVHGDGMRITITAGGKNSIAILSKTGDASVIVQDGEVVVNAPKVVITGSVDMGGSGGAFLVKFDQLLAWTTAVKAALAAAPGGPVNIDVLPGTASTTMTKGA